MTTENSQHLIMLDFDGTLVPLVDHPDAIQVPKELTPTLEALQSSGHAVYIITGRSRESIQKHLPNTKTPIIGLHGLEWPDGSLENRHEMLDKAFSKLNLLAQAHSGSLLEDKKLCLAFHTRRVLESKQEALSKRVISIMRDFADESLEVLVGNKVVELRPKRANKGHAVQTLIKKHASFHPIYIGDDTTDEDAFKVVNSHGTSIRVGPAEIPTHAEQRLPSVQAVYEYLHKSLTPR
ncbi:MAG: trehalose-phosphatase [Deltaproteobacteria bacterium]|nr:trehalose-phosphatase [Deltaproteobacteria bacterium]